LAIKTRCAPFAVVAIGLRPGSQESLHNLRPTTDAVINQSLQKRQLHVNSNIRNEEQSRYLLMTFPRRNVQRC
jgi:hypothetical protein